jgi:hypothetical protein
MIRLIFDSTDEIIPEWENEQERLIFRLAPATVSLGKLLHVRVASREAGAPMPDDEALSMVVTRYEGGEHSVIHAKVLMARTRVREPANSGR